MFGMMVFCGRGGALAEVIDDIVTERAPVDRQLAVSMLDRLRIRRYAADDQGSPRAGAGRRLPRALLRACPHGAVAGLLIVDP
jgi:ATP-grasp domain